MHLLPQCENFFIFSPKVSEVNEKAKSYNRAQWYYFFMRQDCKVEEYCEQSIKKLSCRKYKLGERDVQ
jgi:hypothetical protein